MYTIAAGQHEGLFVELCCLMQDAGTAAGSGLKKSKEGPVLSIQDGAFSDYRWKDGRWDLELFKRPDGKVDWDLVSPFNCDILIYARASQLATRISNRI